jgi:hypothetical protein
VIHRRGPDGGQQGPDIYGGMEVIEERAGALVAVK